MPPLVVDIRTTDDVRDVVHLAVQALAEGKLVAFPTETVYGLAASALDAAAVERLLTVKGRAAGHPLPLAIRGVDDALDYVPDMSPLARRLARRCWPGPVTIVMRDKHPASLMHQLPAVSRQAIMPGDTVGLRVPSHPVFAETLRMIAGPIALSSANRTGGPESTTADDVLKSLGDDVQLVLNDGPCRFGQPSTVVRVHERDIEMLRTGVVSESTLRRLGSFVLLMVCTGNTCRSPMAEALARKLIADRLGCTVEQVEQRGVIVMSAGVAAMMGSRASPEAVEVLARRGLDLSQHESQPLTEQLVQTADMIFAMTRSHRKSILDQWPQAAPRTHLLAVDDSDIADPIGGPPQVYEKCAQQIHAALTQRVAELPL